jgi:hypothetical protein
MKKTKKQLDREINNALRGRGSAAKKSVKRATEDALEVFWQSIAAAYPQATSGDLSPGQTVALERAAEKAVEEWVHYNVR